MFTFIRQLRYVTVGALQIQDLSCKHVGYSVSTGPVQFNATSRFHKHKNIAEYQLNMLLSVLMNEIDSSLDTGQQLIHNVSRK